MDTSGLPLKKPEPRQRVQRRKRRVESTVKQTVRAQCQHRDGDCRLGGYPGHTCGGESEWAHLGKNKRARTRGMPPEVRHTTAGSLMLCTDAHRAYDAGRMTIEALTPDGADGYLLFRVPNVLLRIDESKHRICIHYFRGTGGERCD